MSCFEQRDRSPEPARILAIHAKIGPGDSVYEWS